MGRFWYTIFLRVQVSSWVAAILITLTLRVVEVELILEQKVPIFCINPAVRLGTVRPGGGAGARGRRLMGTRECWFTAASVNIS